MRGCERPLAGVALDVQRETVARRSRTYSTEDKKFLSLIALRNGREAANRRLRSGRAHLPCREFPYVRTDGRRSAPSPIWQSLSS